MTLQDFNEEYFCRFYKDNYTLRNPRHKWHTFLQCILHYRRQGKLLDVGCAMGLFLNQACDYFECTGIDVSLYILRKARNIIPNKVNLVNTTLTEYSVCQGYDVITCFDVLEHITDIEAAMNKLSCLLNPNGLLVITVPVYDGPLGPLVNIVDQDTTHIQRKDRSYWLDLLQSHFTLIEYLGVWRYFFLNRFYINKLTKHFRRVTTAVLLISKKP